MATRRLRHQCMPSVSWTVPAMLSDVGVEVAYNIHSGFAHGEIFALWQGFERSDDGGLIQPSSTSGCYRVRSLSLPERSTVRRRD